jgi:hypothetical protein
MSTRENFLLGSALAVAVFSWTIVGFLERVTGWLYHFTMWEILGFLGYGMVTALLETVVLTLVISAIVTAFVRGRLRTLRFSLSVTLGLLGVALAASFHFVADLVKASPSLLAVFGASSLAVIVLGCYLAVSSPRLKGVLAAFADRSRILAYCIYLPLSVVGILVLTIRALQR